MKALRIKTDGFTLVELLVVVGMISIMTAVAVPMIVSYLPRWKANGVARDISGKLMAARLRAIQENKRYAVKFTFGTRDSFNLQLKSGGVWMDVGQDGHAASGTDIALGANCSQGRVEFKQNGTIGLCNSITVLTPPDNPWIRKLSVSPTTGRISVVYCEQGGC